MKKYMASLESRLFYFLLRVINKKKFLEMQFAFGKFDFYNSKEPPKETYRHCIITRRQIAGRNVFTLSPKSGGSKKHILYFHGGAYVQNFVRQHWKFLSMLVERTKCTITAPDYPLAPIHTYKDVFTMIVPIYNDLLISAKPEDLIIMGDSAGGGIALALAQQLNVERVAQPSQIILLSPWLDITLKNPDIQLIDPVDPFLSVSGLRKAGLAYAGQEDADNFLVSPINGSFSNLGNISIFIGSCDVLVADARKLKTLTDGMGIEINYREYPDMVHVWMLLNFYESRLARNEIVDLILASKNLKSSA